MAIHTLGINHKTASVEVREKVAFAPEHLPDVHHLVCELPAISEAVIVSTCNRSEIYFSVNGVANGQPLTLTGQNPLPVAQQSHGQGKNGQSHYSDHETFNQVLKWLAEYHQISYSELQAASYQYVGLDAVSHLAKVASGLDSMVLGEPQILGQLKSAYAVAQESQTVGHDLNRLFQHSFQVAKEVRTQTAIGENPVSVAYAAVSLSTHIFADLSTCTALLIGAGETIDLVAQHLREKGVTNIIVANRTLTRAQALAEEFGARAIMLGDIPDHLHEADIVISSTASQLPILGKGTVESALRQRRHAPMFMVDIAVPRDIEPQVGQLSDVYLYTVDDLKEVIDENKKSREAAAAEAHEIVMAQTHRYAEQQRALGAVDTIKSFRTHVNDLKDAELARAKKRLAAGEDPQKVLDQLANGLANKFAHHPTTRLKQASAEGKSDMQNWIADIFDLD